MEFYTFIRGALAWTASITCLWPFNIPLLFLAYRIREGQSRVDDDTRVENEDLWPRAALVALLVGVLTAAWFFVDYVAANWLEIPPGLVHFGVFLCFVPCAAFLVAYFFGYEDPFIGLSIFALYLALPIFVLFLLNSLIGFWNPILDFLYTFLKDPKVAQ